MLFFSLSSRELKIVLVKKIHCVPLKLSLKFSYFVLSSSLFVLDFFIYDEC